MRQYLIDELSTTDYQKIKAYLDSHFKAGTMEGIYWVPLEKKLWSKVQLKHQECQPFFIAVDLAETQLSCEFLIRTQNRVRCECMAYADEDQRSWIINCIDAILEKLQITA